LERIQDKDLNKKSIESLIQAGAMDCFGHDRGVLFANIENILFFSKALKEKAISNQNSLFAGTEIEIGNQVTLKDAATATLEEKINWEKELLGIYVTAHPFDYFQKVMSQGITELRELEEYKRDEWVIIGGVIAKASKKITKKGSIMMFVTLEDTTGTFELLVFPKTFEITKDIWQEKNIVCVVGKTPKEQGDNKVFVEKAYMLTKENAADLTRQLSLGNNQNNNNKSEQKKEKSITINLTQEELKQKTESLKELMESSAGDYQVFININGTMIKTKSMIDWNEEILRKIDEVVGKGKVEVGE